MLLTPVVDRVARGRYCSGTIRTFTAPSAGDDDILDLSKIEAGRMELELPDFNFPAALDSALTLVRERAGRHGIALHMTVDERLERVRADERKIRQVVLNLLSNAIKFTPEGGRIEVRAVPVDGSVEVSVTDTGVGIAPEDQEAIFARWASGRPSPSRCRFEIRRAGDDQ